ncbi:MAG: hypothetical protein ACI9R3_000517 [Verrucomicrobiales bacterium]|jgi:hypothetical protein
MSRPLISLSPIRPAFSVSILLLVVALSFSTASAELDEDILGKWSYKGKQAGATIESIAEFAADGVYSCTMQVSIFGTQSKILFKGEWQLEEENIVIKVTETNSPLFLPKGKVMRKQSVKIVENVMTYQYAGKAEREERVIDNQKSIEATPTEKKEVTKAQ